MPGFRTERNRSSLFSSPALAAAQHDARAAKRGLWADANPVPPWEWRAGEKERKQHAVGTGR